MPPFAPDWGPGRAAELIAENRAELTELTASRETTPTNGTT